ncbi:MAG: T9SS type A sorting domain-containing protein, partial [Dinghuibacter sp.]|nr:T9SS type A sorting domain-containing protein [Dinghuibacter sp.]
FAQDVTQQAEGQNIIYTVNTRAICLPITNFKVVDTLPTNVTHISGGTYNAGDRTVTFSPITLAQGASQNNTFTVRVNNGSYFAPTQHINETVAGAVVPAGWAPVSTTAANWRISSTLSFSAPNALFSPDTTIVSDQTLTTPSFTINGVTTLSFQHNYNVESNWDGGVVEISTNNGTTWSDLGNFFTANGYNATLNSTGSNPIRGRRAFSGTSAGFRLSQIDLSSFAGQSIRIRFRFGSDASQGGSGWYVDDILLVSEAAVTTKATLFNAGNAAQLTRSLTAKITQAVVPLRLVSFGGYMNGETAQLQWLTENESGIRYFEVERSFDGAVFAPIQQVTALNSSQRSSYSAADRGLATSGGYTGTAYYRLRITDRNGPVSYSNIVRLSTGKTGLLTLLPNPVNNQLTISGFTDNRKYEAVISDITGKKVLTGTVSSLQHTINTAMLEKGVYILQLRNNETRDVYRFVKD